MERKQTLTDKHQYWNIETKVPSGEIQWDLYIWDWSSLTCVGNFFPSMSTWKPKIFQSIKKVMDMSLFFLFTSLCSCLPGELQEVLNGNTDSKEAPSGENF